jgi:hypothetical protein
MTAERIKFLWFSADGTATVQVPRELKFQKLRNNVLKITNMAKMFNLEVV